MTIHVAASTSRVILNHFPETLILLPPWDVAFCFRKWDLGICKNKMIHFKIRLVIFLCIYMRHNQSLGSLDS